MTIGWGIIGCSEIADKRGAPAINEQRDSQLVAFYSHSAERAEELKDRHSGKRIYNDLDTLLSDDEIDAVYVASPVDRHCAETVASARSGKHVLVEKPMALNAAEGKAMIEAARDNGVHLAVAYYARFIEKSRVMKRIIDGGALGQIVRAHAALLGRYDPAPDDPKHWRVTSRGGGGALADVGSHRFDLLCYFLGSPVKVSGFMDGLSMAYEAPDTETVMVQFESGAHVTGCWNWNCRAGRQVFEIHGTEAGLVTDPWTTEPVVVHGKDDIPPVEVQRPDNVHLPMFDDFASALARGEAPEFSGEDGILATRIIEAAQISARDGQVVTLSA